MATNALAEDPAAAGGAAEAWLAEVAGAELAEPAAVLLLDPELLQAASRPARAVSPAVQASCLTRPGFRPRSTRSIRPMTFRLSRVPTLSGEIVAAVEGQQPPGHHRVGELAGDLGPGAEKPGENRPAAPGAPRRPPVSLTSLGTWAGEKKSGAKPGPASSAYSWAVA